MKRLMLGDSRALLKDLDSDSIHCCICDPPYHLTTIVKRFGKPGSAECQQGTDGAYARAAKGFMGKEWDGGDIAFDPTFWAEVLRVLKPGGHLLAFGGSRTSHRLTVAIEDAGFEIRDTVYYCYATGFPKSHDVSKGIDKLNGHVRPVVGKCRKLDSYGVCNDVYGGGPNHSGEQTITSAASAASAAWEGYGTALKPAVEPIILARKPLSESSVARNVLKHGAGAINIDACRIHSAGSESKPYTVKRLKPGATLAATGGNWRPKDGPEYAGETADGRWPANLLLSCQCVGPHAPGCPVAELDRQSGEGRSVYSATSQPIKTSKGHQGGGFGADSARHPAGHPTHDGYVRGGFTDSGGASRFFFIAKPTRREKGERNTHPTVKPVALMKYLCRLVCPLDGIVLDPFMGSGTTGIGATLGGFDFIGMEREPDYFAIAEARNGAWKDYEDAPEAGSPPDQVSLCFDTEVVV